MQAVKENKKCILLKIDVDAHPEAAAKFGVTSLPTVIGYKDGVNLGTFMGARDKLFVSKFISQVTSEEKTGSA